MGKVVWDEKELWKEVEKNTKDNLRIIGRMVLRTARAKCPVGKISRSGKYGKKHK
jgi:hypothetical protein